MAAGGPINVGSVAPLCLLLAACAATAPPPPADPVVDTGLERRPIPPSGLHAVEPGETLSEIAYIYRLDVDALAKANGLLDPDHVVAGRTLSLRWNDPPRIGAPPKRAAREEPAPTEPPAPAAQPLRVVVTPR